MGKTRVGMHPVIMGEGEPAGRSFDTFSDIFKAKQQKPVSGQSKSGSALPNNATSTKSFKQRIRSALSLSSKRETKYQKSADTTADSEEIESSESEKCVYAPYLMDLPLEQIRSYRPKEGTYGKGVSVRGLKKGVREFGELLLDMCLEDILKYRGDYNYKSVPFIVVTPCAEEAKPAFLVNSLDNC